MHYLIRLIVDGENKAEALENAETYAQDLCGQNESGLDHFDWYDMDGRWGKSEVFGVNTIKGKRLIKDGMQSTRKEFESAMAHVRYMVDHFTNDEIFEQKFGTHEEQREIADANDDIYHLSRYQFACAAGGFTKSSFIYSEEWGEVTNQHDLDLILNDDKKLWVVAVDFHN